VDNVAIYKRGKKYWYKFMWNGEMVRESTKQGNDRVARNMESAHRTALAQGLVGIREKKHAPTLKEFCDTRVEPWAKATFEHTCPNNWLWFRAGLRRLTGCDCLASTKLDEITNEKLAGFAAYEQGRLQKRGRVEGPEKRGLAVSSINSSIRVLRRVLSLAAEWGVIESMAKLALLPGERHRERVVTPEEENRYLAAAPVLVANVATVLGDTGMRPDECYRLRWEDVTWVNGRNGTLLVTQGKTRAARRVLPMTPRVRTTLQQLWEAAGEPLDGWVWRAPTMSGHIDHSSLKKQHARAFRIVNAEAKKKGFTLVKPFVLYSLRHTFLTRLGQSGCDAWTLARIAGHSSITISSRYVHPSEDTVLAAFSKLGGHNFGHSAKNSDQREAAHLVQADEMERQDWRARRDSNSRPIAPEAIALSS
jgi:integrase